MLGVVKRLGGGNVLRAAGGVARVCCACCGKKGYGQKCVYGMARWIGDGIVCWVWKNGREKKDGSRVARKIYSTYIVCTFDWRDGTVYYPLHEIHIKLAPPAVWPAACYCW